MSGPEVLGGAVCRVDDDLLMVRHGIGPAGGLWSVPRVALSPGEAAGEAVVRACLDQAGCEVLCGPFLGWDEHPEDRPHTVELYFEAVLVDPANARPHVPGASTGTEAPAEARFVPLDSVVDLRLAAGVAEFLAEAGVIDTVV